MASCTLLLEKGTIAREENWVDRCVSFLTELQLSLSQPAQGPE